MAGWYDYGARMYDPQLGRWHVVDPMAEKYNGWSPYAYVANNPINLIDPSGMEWEDPIVTEDKDGNKHIQFTVNLKVKNSANLSDKQINEYTNAIKSQVQESFKGKNEDGSISYSTVVNIDFESEVNEKTDFYIDYVDEVQMDKKEDMSESNVGKVDEIGNTQTNRIQIKANQDKMAQTGAHEIGHTGGLTHPAIINPKIDENGVYIGGKGNLMYSGTGTMVTHQQLNKVNSTITEGYQATPVGSMPNVLKPIILPVEIK